nr:hypothetical protein Iba_chr10aCG13430 [Ipomoea batatas]
MEDKTSGGVANLRERSEAGEVVDHRSRGESTVVSGKISSAVVRSPVLLSSEIQCHRLPHAEPGITQIEPISSSIHWQIGITVRRVQQVWGEGNGRDDRASAFDDLPSAIVIAGASITGSGNMVQKEMDTKRNGRINSGVCLEGKIVTVTGKNQALVIDIFTVLGFARCVGFVCWVFQGIKLNFPESCFAGKNKGSLLLARRHRRRPEPDGDGLRPRDLPRDNPLTTSTFRAEKNPCFLSILSRTP